MAVPTSTRRYLWRRHLGSKMAAPEMTSTKTWGGLFDPYWGVRSKMAALPLPAAILDDLICGTENEVIQDGRRKRKGRHLAPHSSMGVEKAALYYSWRWGHFTFRISPIHLSVMLIWDLSDVYEPFWLSQILAPVGFMVHHKGYRIWLDASAALF